MQTYEVKYAEMMKSSAEAVVEAIDFELKTSKFSLDLFFYTFVGAMICAGLGIFLDHTIFTFYLPLAYFASSAVLNFAAACVSYQASCKKSAADNEFFRVSKEISEYNSQKLMELMAMQEMIKAMSPDAPAECRSIN